VRQLIATIVVLCVLGLNCSDTAAIAVDPDKIISVLDESALQRLPISATPKGTTFTQVIDHRDFAVSTAAALPATLTDVWYRIPISNNRETPVQIIVDFREMLLDEIEFHSNVDGNWKTTLTGLRYPYPSRALDYPYFAFPLELPAHYEGYVYFRVNGAHPASVSPALYGPQLFHQVMLDSLGTSLLLIGILAGVIVVMATIILTLQEMRLFALLALLGGMLINIAYTNGLIFKFIPNLPDFHRSLYIYSITFTNIMMSQLCIGLFDLRRTRPLFYGISLLLQVLCIALSVMTLFQDPAPFVGPVNFGTLLIVLLAFVIGIDAQMRNAQSAALFNAGLTSWLFVTLFTILGVNGILPFNFWSRHAYEAGLLVLCVFFSLTIIDRLRYYRCQHDALLQKAAAAETREQLKSEFLAAMSHEIRTPLNGVLGMAQMLMQTEQSPTQRYYTDIITSSGKTLLNVLNDILDLSKAEVGKLRLVKENVDLGQLITYAGTIARSFPEKSDIHFEYRIDPAVPLFALADNSRLQQILTNLLNNAFKFTEHGSIYFSVEIAADQSAMPQNHTLLRFSVRDTGAGLSEEQCQSLFNAYAQVELQQASRYRGTGLGLSICKHLVELMHGRIGVTSTPGVGSEFWFEIPVQLDIERQREHEKMFDALRGKHLLIVNISEKHARLLSEQFRHIGMQVSHAYTTTLDDLPTFDVLLCMPATAVPSLQAMAEYCKQQDKPAILLIPAGIADQTLNSELPSHVITLLVPAGITEFIAALHSALTRRKRDTIAPATHAIALRPLHVLVAEDNPVNQKVVAAMLQRLGATYTLTNNGSEAVDVLMQQREFDLVLMDCEMPVMDGYAAAAAIRRWEKDHARAPLPIVALTAHALPAYIDRCHQAGIDQVLTKPLDINVLAATLNNLPQR